MATARLTGYQRQVAERNVEAILDAAEELLQQGQANISAVAVLAGVSRVTVYAHFPTWQARSWRQPSGGPCAGRWPPWNPRTPMTARPSRR